MTSNHDKITARCARQRSKFNFFNFMLKKIDLVNIINNKIVTKKNKNLNHKISCSFIGTQRVIDIVEFYFARKNDAYYIVDG